MALLSCLPLFGGLTLAGHASADAATSPVDVLEPQQEDNNAGNSGPVRMARVSYLSGEVTWRTDAQAEWSPAARNMPLRQGAQVWVAEGGRAEIQMDDGSRIRLDNNTMVTLQTLYSDAEGEFTEITLNDGELFMRLNNQYSVYQVNTPEASLKATGPARLRVGAGDGAQFAVRQGKATIDGASGKVTLQQGDYVDVAESTAPYNVGPLPNADAWDAWNDARDRDIDNPVHAEHLPPNIALAAGNLDAYGSWHEDPTYGWIWAPRVTDPDWRPYGAGQWTWVEPYGWTWVASEPWGWAPYHYGTWVHVSYGWAWVPGPATQYWSPAVVSFYQVGTRVAWCPLAPREVVYPPALAIGFRGADWSLFFSIGRAAVYYPGPERVFVARPWPTTYVNHVTYVTNVTNVTNITINRNTYVTNTIVPANARFQGGTQVEVEQFAGRTGAYRPVTRADVAIFTQGRAIGAPTGGASVAGPQNVRVTASAFTPTRTYLSQPPVPREVANRSVFRASLPARVPSTVATPQPGQRFITRSATGNVSGGSSRTNAGSGSSGRSSALEEYLRDRESSRGRGADTTSGGGNRSTQSGSDTNYRENTRADNRSSTSPREDTRNTSQSPERSRGNTSGANSGSSRSGSYRPLHTRTGSDRGGGRSGGDSRSSGDSRERSDRSGGDRGHQ